MVLAVLSIQLAAGQDNGGRIDRYFKRKMEKAGVVGMQLGVIKKDGTIWTANYGKKDQKTAATINDSTLFMIASCSKPVTALGVLKLYNDQQLDLDSDINHYLPFRVVNPNFAKDSITIRMLLSHTATFKDNWKVLDPLYTIKTGGDSPIELSDFIREYFSPPGKYFEPDANFFKKRPGTYWEYSNMGYALLGLIIEQVSQKDFGSFMREEIFAPLNMKNSYWFLDDIQHPNIAKPHVLPENKNDSIKVLKHYGYPDFPDGQLRTTAEDYLKFIQLILNEGQIKKEQFIAKEVIALFHSIQFPDVHKHQAVAWNYDEFDNWLYYLLMKRLPSHTGGDPGVATCGFF